MRKYYRNISLILCTIGMIVCIILGVGVVLTWKYDDPPLLIRILLIIFSIIGVIYSIFDMATQRYMKNINRYCKEHGVSIEELEADFAVSQKTESFRRVGREWIFGFDELRMPVVKEMVPIQEYRKLKKEEEQADLYQVETDPTDMTHAIYGVKRERMEEILGKYRSKRQTIVSMIIIFAIIGFIAPFEAVLNKWIIIFSFGIIGLIEAFICCKEDKLKKIEYYCRNSGCTMDELLQDFEYSKEVGKRVWYGREWIFYIGRRSLPDVVSRRGITHMEYKMGIAGGNLRLYSMDILRAKIRMTKQDAEKLKNLL